MNVLRNDPNYMKEYYAKNKERLSILEKEYHKKNKEKRNAQSRAYHEKNKEACNAYAREYYVNNKERWPERNKKWYQKNKAYYRAKDALRGSRKSAVNDIITAEDKWVLQEMYELSALRTESTGIPWHVDHINPLSKGGRHCLTNLQVVPAVWNLSKGNHNADRFFGAT